MSDRAPSHVAAHPMAGDVLEIREPKVSQFGDDYDYEVMLRVVAVHENRVWFKEYGKGHFLVHASKWKERIEAASASEMIRGADHDSPF